MNHDDNAFDARQRGTWRTAVAAVPPSLAWRLRPAAPMRTHASSRWPLGAALAAAAVVAISLGLRPHPATVPQAVSSSGASVVVASADTDDATATLDRNPDFYAWLASSDAEQLAME